jgi:hypothetical protein
MPLGESRKSQRTPGQFHWVLTRFTDGLESTNWFDRPLIRWAIYFQVAKPVKYTPFSSVLVTAPAGTV